MFVPTFAVIGAAGAGLLTDIGALMVVEHVAMLAAMPGVMLLRPAEYAHHRPRGDGMNVARPTRRLRRRPRARLRRRRVRRQPHRRAPRQAREPRAMAARAWAARRWRRSPSAASRSATNGLTLELARTHRAARAAASTLAFRIVDRSGRTVRDFDVEHTKRMHFIVVRRDMTGFQHLHPTQRADGTLVGPRRRCRDAGTYRVFADFSVGGKPHTLADDLTVDGSRALAAAARAGARASTSTACASRSPRARPGPAPSPSSRSRSPATARRSPSSDYLGAKGHLVALRQGDLAFLHVHPDEDRLRFMATFPTAGRYRLFLQFKTADGRAPHRRLHPGGDPMSATRARRAADHRHDLRLVRQPHRAQAQQARRRHRDGQLRHREGPRRVRPGRGRRPSSSSAAVEAAGYRPRCRRRAGRRRRAEPDETAPLRRRLIIAALLSVPALLMAMIPALQFDNFQWLSLNLVTPVVLWAAWPFHQAAWANLKHGAATMDTLISLGTLAAWLWSLYALFIGDAGMNDMRMAFDVIPNAGRGRRPDLPRDRRASSPRSCSPAATSRRKAKRRAGAALKALLELGAKDVAILDADGAERRVPVEQLAVGDRFVVRPGEKVATDGIVEEGTSRRRHEHAHRRVGPGRGRSRARRSRARPSTPAAA